MNQDLSHSNWGKTMRLLACLLTLGFAASSINAAELPKLRVSNNKRFIVTTDGKPFFYLADTAWELFHWLDRANADKYLSKRAGQGLTVIQAVAIAEIDGHTVPNAYGHLPLIDLDPATPAVKRGPDNDYWDHVDYIVDTANANGLYVGFLPTWGRYWRDNYQGDKPEMAGIKPDGADLKMLGEGHDPTISPDGKSICYTGHAGGGVSVFVMNLDGGNKKQILKEVSKVGATFPNWSPDSKEIVYSFPVGESLELFVVHSDGMKNRQLTKLNKVATPADWSPDGKWISFRLTDERYRSDAEKMKKVYAENPPDKRPVWVVKPDGADAHVIASLRFQCAMNVSRAAWKPTER